MYFNYLYFNYYTTLVLGSYTCDLRGGVHFGYWTNFVIHLQLLDLIKSTEG